MSSKPIKGSLATLTNTLATGAERLAEYVKWRKVRQAMACIAEWLPQLQAIPLSSLPLEARSHAISLLSHCAWGIDYDGRLFDQVKSALESFKKQLSKDLSRTELALMAIAEGLLEFHQQHYQEAEVLFEDAQHRADKAEDQELIIVSRYYRGRALSKQRLYSSAVSYFEQAIELDLEWNRNHARVAAMELAQHWTLFLMGDAKQAREVLERAQERLGNECLVDQGNIVAALGRYHLQAGEYRKALDCFTAAIEIYQAHYPAFRNVPRTLVNKAFALRLIIRDLGNPVPKGSRDSAELQEKRVEFQKLLEEAFALLRLAEEIYGHDKGRSMHFHELSKLHSVRALLHFDEGKYREAELEVKQAFKIAENGCDNIGMANALSIQSKLALDAGIKDFVDAPAARRYARKAITYAEKTENRRAIARAYMHAARALTHSPYNDPFGARTYLRKAQERLESEDRDYLRASIMSLEKVIDECSKRRHSEPVINATVGYVEECLSEKLSINDIANELEDRLIQWTYKRCDGSLRDTVRQLISSNRKVGDAVSFFKITDKSLKKLDSQGAPADVLTRMTILKNRSIQGTGRFMRLVKQNLDINQRRWAQNVLDCAERRVESF